MVHADNCPKKFIHMVSTQGILAMGKDCDMTPSIHCKNPIGMEFYTKSLMKKTPLLKRLVMVQNGVGFTLFSVFHVSPAFVKCEGGDSQSLYILSWNKSILPLQIF